MADTSRGGPAIPWQQEELEASKEARSERNSSEGGVRSFSRSGKQHPHMPSSLLSSRQTDSPHLKPASSLMLRMITMYPIIEHRLLSFTPRVSRSLARGRRSQPAQSNSSFLQTITPSRSSSMHCAIVSRNSRQREVGQFVQCRDVA